MNPDYRVNLERASILLLDTNSLGMSILGQVFGGFGARRLHKCPTVNEARDLLRDTEVNLIVLNDELDGEPGFEVVRWLRRLENNVNSFASVILVAGHIRRSMVQRTRDCGANFLIAKPLAPAMMLERVVWVSKEKRPFLETGDYAGPDRRFHVASESENLGRRRVDEKASSAEISALMEGPAS